LSRLRSPLPLPRVRGKRLVVYNRVDSWGLTFAQGYFSEFHAVLGAVRYAEQHAAREVLVKFDNGYYLDAAQGPNWWAYFFEELIPVNPAAGTAGEVHCRGWHRYGPHFFNDSWVDLATPPTARRRPTRSARPSRCANAGAWPSITSASSRPSRRRSTAT
jgi:hypothetical protein